MVSENLDANKILGTAKAEKQSYEAHEFLCRRQKNKNILIWILIWTFFLAVSLFFIFVFEILYMIDFMIILSILVMMFIFGTFLQVKKSLFNFSMTNNLEINIEFHQDHLVMHLHNKYNDLEKTMKYTKKVRVISSGEFFIVHNGVFAVPLLRKDIDTPDYKLLIDTINKKKK